MAAAKKASKAKRLSNLREAAPSFNESEHPAAAPAASSFTIEEEIQARLARIEVEICAMVAAQVEHGAALHSGRAIVDNVTHGFAVVAKHNFKNVKPLQQTPLRDHRRQSRARFCHIKGAEDEPNTVSGQSVGTDVDSSQNVAATRIQARFRCWQFARRWNEMKAMFAEDGMRPDCSPDPLQHLIAKVEESRALLMECRQICRS